MQKSKICIVTCEGRQVSAHWDFRKVVSMPIISGVLTLPDTRVPVITKILEFASHHLYDPSMPNIPKPLKSHEIKSVVENDWDTDFFNNLDVQTVIDIIEACEYIGYKALSELSQAYIATLFKSKNIEELKILFLVDKEYIEE
jgi:hypothetical protein